MKVMRTNFSKFGIQQSSLYSTSTKSQKNFESIKIKSTIDDQDVKFHSNHKDGWWDTNGKVKLLHAMNPVRIQLVRDGLADNGFKEINRNHPLKNLKVLDVGCGGGILSEALAKMGANVVGLDASKELISIAREHARLKNDLSSNLTYVSASIEEFSKEKKEEFDAIVASEIIEHVTDQELFVKSCVKVLKPKGSIFITTFNRTFSSWLVGIIGAEYITRLIPLGTHDWNRFIKPQETKKLLENCNCETKMITGMIYNPATKTWSYSSSTFVTYALHAVKQ